MFTANVPFLAARCPTALGEPAVRSNARHHVHLAWTWKSRRGAAMFCGPAPAGVAAAVSACRPSRPCYGARWYVARWYV